MKNLIFLFVSTIIFLSSCVQNSKNTSIKVRKVEDNSVEIWRSDSINYKILSKGDTVLLWHYGNDLGKNVHGGEKYVVEK